jgi:hypothetical protein
LFVCYYGLWEEDNVLFGVAALKATRANIVEELQKEATLREEGD